MLFIIDSCTFHRHSQQEDWFIGSQTFSIQYFQAIYHLTYAMASTALGPTAAPLVNGGHPPALAAIKEAEEARTRKIEAENKFRKQQQQQQRLNLASFEELIKYAIKQPFSSHFSHTVS